MLASLGATASPRLLVLNKADRLDAAAREQLARGLAGRAAALLARPAPTWRALRERITAFFERDMVEEELLVPYAQQRVAAEAHATTNVLAETHDEHGTHLRVRAAPEAIARLRSLLSSQ